MTAFQQDAPADGTALPAPVDSEKFIRLLLDAAPDGLALVDADGRLVLVTRRLEEMFGYDIGDLIGKPVEVLLPAGLRSRHVLDRTAFQSTPNVRPMGAGRQLIGRRADGTELPVEISLSPVVTEEHGLCVIAAVRDQASRQEAVAERVHALAVQQRLRIAHGLSDTVIAGLFGAGLTLAGTVDLCDEPARARVQQAIADIDQVISALRAVIFDLDLDL